CGTAPQPGSCSRSILYGCDTSRTDNAFLAYCKASSAVSAARLTRPRPPSLDRISRIVEAGRRGMAADDEPVDQRLVFRGEAIVECADVVVPMLFGARAGDHAGDEGGIQHPGHRE